MTKKKDLYSPVSQERVLYKTKSSYRPDTVPFGNLNDAAGKSFGLSEFITLDILIATLCVNSSVPSIVSGPSRAVFGVCNSLCSFSRNTLSVYSGFRTDWRVISGCCPRSVVWT